MTGELKGELVFFVKLKKSKVYNTKLWASPAPDYTISS